MFSMIVRDIKMQQVLHFLNVGIMYDHDRKGSDLNNTQQ